MQQFNNNSNDNIVSGFADGPNNNNSNINAGVCISESVSSLDKQSVIKIDHTVKKYTQPIDPNYIQCECGNLCHRKKKFSVYEVDFCSLACLQKLKEIEDEKRKPKEPRAQFKAPDFGGSACF